MRFRQLGLDRGPEKQFKIARQARGAYVVHRRARLSAVVFVVAAS